MIRNRQNIFLREFDGPRRERTFVRTIIADTFAGA
jgi:hypothetical protein